ncbi:CD248 molecule, endosialin a [Thalassophryne amazonica]|uniref:CD248 molecule, endosialin a n=1 Tax=Thalassophryne amazonica TaxID=390379 RepID=UPI001470BCE5|nr:CD248 molecule, endosialin a [Thalassophryne amazonica]
MCSLLGSASALLLTPLLALIFGLSVVLTQNLRETDALCNSNGCFVVYFQRKTFLDSWRACKEKEGNLATIKRQEDADAIATLFSDVDLRYSRLTVRVWIGLQRQPRQCTAARPLRGFSWTTGDQDTQYTNWQNADSSNTCSVPRCVVMGYSTVTHEQKDNFKWLEGSCSVPVDGYLCHYAYPGMCSMLWPEGAGNALYSTPFNLQSTILTHVPYGSVAAMPCPTGVKDLQTILCMLKDDGSVGWSDESPLCPDSPLATDGCDQNNGGCQHICRPARDHFYCECADGFELGVDGQSCELSDVCQDAPCEMECLPVSDGYRCACPQGYMLATDEHGCLDVDECLQSPCEQLCVNTLGSFQCQCRQGYQLDEDGVCEDVDECAKDPCEHACENMLGSYICHCHLGFSLVPDDPSRCQDTDECQMLGTCEQMCVNYEGGFECYCGEGYELMSDHYSCEKIKELDSKVAATPPFLWVTHHPGPVWVPEDSIYNWNLQQSQTDWPPELGEPLDWMTDPPNVADPNVIWVTSAPDLPLDSAVNIPTSALEEERMDRGRAGQISDWQELDPSPSILSTSAPPTTSLSTTSYWYEDDEEATTDQPLLPTATISEGAWNWWEKLTTTTQKPGTESSYQKETEDYVSFSETLPFLDHKVGREEDRFDDFSSPPGSIQVSPSEQPPTDGIERGDISVQEGRNPNHGTTWLLVGLLVPICIVIVVMVALGIIYCSRCPVETHSKNNTDCYHWISGAHDKQGSPNAAAGLKTHV